MLIISIYRVRKLFFVLLVASLFGCVGGQKSNSLESPVQSKPIKNNYKVNLISPVGEVNYNKIAFSWDSIDKATDYELVIKTNSLKNKKYRVNSVQAHCSQTKQVCSHSPNLLFKQGDQFTWWVKSKVSGNWSELGSGKKVLIKTASKPPQEPEKKGFLKLLPPLKGGVYFGAFSDFSWSEDDVTTQKINHFDQLAKKNTAWSYFSNNWLKWEGVAEIKYPSENIKTIRQQGKIPFIRLLPWKKVSQIKDADITSRASKGIDLINICHQDQDSRTMLITKGELNDHLNHGDYEGNCDNPYTMQSIIDGTWDDDFKRWATAAKSDVDDDGKQQPLLVTFTIEMNGYWFPWSGIYHGGANKTGYGDPDLADGPERFRDAYRHIIDLFRKQGVKNITWFFVPDTMDPDEKWVSFLTEDWNAQRNYYPGDDYIDWIGTNLYGAAAQDYNWTWFADDWSKKSHAINAISSKKPLALMEFGVIENHQKGTKSDWLDNAFDTFEGSDYPFQAVSYWHDDLGSGTDGMKIDSSPESLATFQNRIKNAKYKSILRFSQ